MDSKIIFGVTGIFTAFVTFLSPARELYKIWLGRSSEQYFSAVPFHAAFINCTLWMMYGYIHGDIFLSIIYNVGYVMAMCYLTMFILITRSDTLVDMMKHEAIFLFELTCLEVLGRLAQTFKDPAKYAGTVCAVGSTLICVVKMVHEARREDREPFFASLASFANAVIWSVYGLILSDMFILVPNLAWALLGLVQVAQYAVNYRSAQPEEVEMGSMSRTEAGSEM